MMVDRTFELKRQAAQRQILALTVLGGAMIVLFIALVGTVYFS